MRKLILFAVALPLLISCSKNDPAIEWTPGTGESYYPPVSGTKWETISPDSLKWSNAAINDLYTFLQIKNTKGLMILKDGKIASEKYFGSFTTDSSWYWASAGKTMTAVLTGIAAQEGKLSIDDKVSKYLGAGWTSIPREKEDLITIRHMLSMTTGLKATGSDLDCDLPSCLGYSTDAGAEWSYMNAPYSLLKKLIAKAAGKPFETYFREKIGNPIGMNGSWNMITDFVNVYQSNTRSAARFGLLMLNNGKWMSSQLVNSGFINAQTTTSQNHNPSYGYLTWLNGKSSYIIPGVAGVKPGAIVPNAPADMFYAWGRDDQKIYIVPSMKIVVVRLGQSGSATQAETPQFDNELWQKLKAVFNY